MNRRRLSLLPVLVFLIGCNTSEDIGAPESAVSAPTETTAAREPSTGGPGTEDTPIDPNYVPEPDMTDMESAVEKRLTETRSAVVANPQSAAAWGRFGMVNHAHELWEEAAYAYRRAMELDGADVRWPYFLGDVLSVVGTDPGEAAGAFRRALALRPDYAPTHMRLGKVLIAGNKNQDAVTHLEKALELQNDLQPARVALAQIRLAEGRLDDAESMLDTILDVQPRHAQALSTLGQVYMRQGKREEARVIAQRARSAAIYNLYSDPLMGEVVNEGVSSVLIWERAKAFLDNGNFEQAALGLRQVVGLLPGNADAHQQLAMAYHSLGNAQGAREHLEKALAREPDLVDARVQLANIYLDHQEPRSAITHLRHALGKSPDDPDAGWLMGKALVMAGDARGGLEAFEAAEANAESAGLPIPDWVHNDWGSALAQSGRVQEAQERFRAALAVDPENPQSLFYMGLLFEGTGRFDDAVDHYCRSMRAQPNPLADGRLKALGQHCF